LISDLVRGAWLRNVRQQNLDVVGESTDLTEFLFGSERANLAVVRGVLEQYVSHAKWKIFQSSGEQRSKRQVSMATVGVMKL
jgi:hypothetical protein